MWRVQITSSTLREELPPLPPPPSTALAVRCALEPSPCDLHSLHYRSAILSFTQPGLQQVGPPYAAASAACPPLCARVLPTPHTTH